MVDEQPTRYGPAADAALALEHEAGGNPMVRHRGVRRAIQLAPRNVREIRLYRPARQPDTSPLDVTLFLMDAGIRR